MGYQYDYIDGQRVEKNVASAFRKWAADFKKETGQTLHVRSGTRTVAEQQKGRDDYLSGRTKVKWADPKESSHCEIGPAGPRALDLYDSGRDAGVTTKGTHRHNVAVRLGAKYGFTWGGWGVPASEGWHFENHKVKVGVYGTVKKAATAVKSAVTSAVTPASAMLKWRWAGVQEMLRVHYNYRAGIDNNPGGPDGRSQTVAAHRRFLNAKGYAQRALGRNLRAGKWDRNDVKANQVWLASRKSNPYRGKIDGIPGKQTRSSWDTAERENAAAF
ncbi:hypothetical protein [Microbacterium sp. UBA3394]|uniref:hypothetical protein n=1 Tax=Microbacterium sp. UBA3394 TaxID=1946945 RepID=UPI000C67737A|nr:hypothetical protein [Microbacterium sp. UBA3394]MAB20232.1 hypothetical protein [Microbacterium sp.]MAM53532.1 hypothetical protein [Microbacterium sp.]